MFFPFRIRVAMVAASMFVSFSASVRAVEIEVDESDQATVRGL